jgi:hypothetical protein
MGASDRIGDGPPRTLHQRDPGRPRLDREAIGTGHLVGRQEFVHGVAWTMRDAARQRKCEAMSAYLLGDLPILCSIKVWPCGAGTCDHKGEPAIPLMADRHA